MTTTVSVPRSGHDVGYFNAGHGAASCAGAMAYYARSGEPPGQWAGGGAERLGLRGQVDPDVIQNLYMNNVSPTGEVLAKPPKQKDGTQDVAVARAVHAYRRTHPYASSVELDEVRAKERAKARKTSVPYFDQTVSMVKSASVLHASYRVGAMLERARGATGLAAVLDARADAIEAALVDAARDAVQWLEQHAAYTRTGYHSATTGEWRDAAGGPKDRGLTAALFLHHLSRDGDPHLHVHIAIWNRVQRADGVDGKYRTLYGRALFRQRLGLAPVPDRFAEKRLRDLGYVMVPRADGNGCEVGGVSEKVMARFSSRHVAIGAEVAKLAGQWKAAHGGKEPNARTLWLLHQQAGQNTRRTKAQARRTVAGQVRATELTEEERLAAWETQTAADEMAALSLVWQYAEQFARERGPFAEQERERALAGAPAVQLQPAVLPPVPDTVLTEPEKAKAARVAVAEVQQRHAAWGMAELRFEIHRALPAGVSEADVTQIAGLVTSGRSGTGVVQIGVASDIADVSSLGVRESDGVSVYRPPGEERWCTLDHLDLEQHVVEQARAEVPQLVTLAEAKAAVARTDLTPAQAEAVVALLTAETATVPLNAAAGSGKSHTMAVFSRLWTEFTGARVVGLTTSTNAAEVLANEGLAESYNIAQFLGKVKDSDELRRPVRIGPGDVLVLDEATQASTADVALVQQAARAAGSRLHPVGDTRQLGSVDAGGIFSLLVTELGGPQMEEILRFEHRWEAAASIQLAKGDIAAVAAYDRRGRVYAGDREAMFDQAAQMGLADYLAGKYALLLAGSNAEAADLARRVQAKLVQMGRVGAGEVELADGNMAGLGDRIRARENTTIEADGRTLNNRDTLLISAIGADHVWTRRQVAPGQWSAPFQVPVSYLGTDAELDYAGNVHVSEGRTVDVGRTVVTDTLSRPSLYVAGTRGRSENFFHVVTGNTAPKGHVSYKQATAEQVIKEVMERDGSELSATEQMRGAQEWAGGAGHVLHLWSTTVRRDLYPAIDRQIMTALTPEQARRYEREYARQALHARLREAQLAGHDLDEVIARITAEDLGGARSVSSVVHSRLEGLGLDPVHDATWEQRTPIGASQLSRDLARGLDDRTRELGVRATEQVEPWLARRLGVLDPTASPAMRADYERRAGVAAAYREAAGITDPEQDVAPEPHEGNPELETWRTAAMRVLEIRDQAEAMRAMSRGQLEAHVARAERTVAAAPADMSAQLRQAAQAKADAWREHADAQVRSDLATADASRVQAQQHAADEADLEQQHAGYERWSTATAQTRELGGKAQAELDRRGYAVLDRLAEIDEAEEQRRADIDFVNKATARELESAIPDEVWEQARQLRAQRIADAAALREARAAGAVRALEAGEDPWESGKAQPEAGDDTQAGPGPAPTRVEDRAARTPGDPRAAETATSRDAQPSSLSPDIDLKPDPGPELYESWAGTAARVTAVNAQLDELSARAEEVKAERAERQAADDYHVQLQAGAERAAAAEPAAELAAQADYVDAGMDLEPG
jgi:hypothetical protein